jgi:hypothetical protein
VTGIGIGIGPSGIGIGIGIGLNGAGDTCACAEATIDCTTGLLHSLGKLSAEATTPLPATTPFSTWRRPSERAGQLASSLGAVLRFLALVGCEGFLGLRGMSDSPAFAH